MGSSLPPRTAPAHVLWVLPAPSQEVTSSAVIDANNQTLTDLTGSNCTASDPQGYGWADAHNPHDIHTVQQQKDRTLNPPNLRLFPHICNSITSA